MTETGAVDLVAMTAPEFDAYVEETIRGYAADRADADGIPYEAALGLARRQIAAIREDRAAGASHGFVVRVRATGERVGAVWLLVRSPAVHLADIRIDERFRRRGFGAATLVAVEAFARAAAATCVTLHVFGRNAGARALYERSGYEVTGLSLRKELLPASGDVARAAAPRATSLDDVLAWLGTTDVYLLDQVMRGRLRPPMRVLDAGCGDGRNVELLLRAGFEVHGVDASAEAIERVRARARAAAAAAPPATTLAPTLVPTPASTAGDPATRFRVGTIEAMDFPDASFDAVLCVAALHFARDRAHFDAMVEALGRVLRPGGLLFVRLATSIGLADRFVALGDGRFRLGDGTDRFLVDEARLLALTASLGGELADPLKTVNVQGQRAMTTWVVRKVSPCPLDPVHADELRRAVVQVFDAHRGRDETLEKGETTHAPARSSPRRRG